jgi:hypothetical protein
MMAAVESLGRSIPGAAGSSGSRVAIFALENGRAKGFPAGEPIQIKVGREVGFSLRPPMDSRLYVMNYNPQSMDDEIVFLYPLPRFAPMTFRKDTTYEFPRCVDPKALSYPVEPPLGRMCFKVIGIDASQEGLDPARGLPSSLGYYQMDINGLKALLKDLASLPASSWWEESLEFWVVE